MFYQVQQVRVDRRNRRLYLLIHFWRTRAAFELGRPPVLINDFILGLSKERIREEIRDIILGYWRRWRDILPGARTASPSLSVLTATVTARSM